LLTSPVWGTDFSNPPAGVDGLANQMANLSVKGKGKGKGKAHAAAGAERAPSYKKLLQMADRNDAQAASQQRVLAVLARQARAKAAAKSGPRRIIVVS
jgi:hypothetical protein